MNHTQFKKERRRFVSTEPRAALTIATINNTKLVLRNGLAHVALLGLGFEELMQCEPDAVLMRAPENFEVVGA